MYVYIQSEPGLWTVGFYTPDGKWVSESDHTSKADAAERVHYLSGPQTEDRRPLREALLVTLDLEIRNVIIDWLRTVALPASMTAEETRRLLITLVDEP